jgi:hypothetical protein
VLAAGAGGSADAGLIVSNIDHTDAPIPVDPFDAQAFTAGGANQVLGSVTLRLGDFSGAAQTVTVSLNSDASGQPGESVLALGSISLAADTPSFADYTVTAPSPFTLQANTTYWVVAQTDSGDFVFWSGTLSTASTGPGTLGPGAVRPDTVARWDTFTSARYELEVDAPALDTPAAATVPEPASLTLLSVGAAGLLGYAWRRRPRCR